MWNCCVSVSLFVNLTGYSSEWLCVHFFNKSNFNVHLKWSSGCVVDPKIFHQAQSPQTLPKATNSFTHKHLQSHMPKLLSITKLHYGEVQQCHTDEGWEHMVDSRNQNHQNTSKFISYTQQLQPNANVERSPWRKDLSNRNSSWVTKKTLNATPSFLSVLVRVKLPMNEFSHVPQ